MRHKKGIYLIGAAKCGTTSIARNLGRHPDIDFNPENKEPHYHIRDSLKNVSETCEMWKKSKAILDRNLYEINFFGAGSFFLDASPMYLPYSEESIRSILEFHENRVDEIFIIIMVRDPLERMLSQYAQMQKNGVEPLTFTEAIGQQNYRSECRMHPFFQYTKFSNYFDNVIDFTNTFPNVTIVEYETFAKNQVGVISALFRFLLLNSGNNVYQDRSFHNKTGNGIKSKIFQAFLEKKNFKFVRRSVSFFMPKQLKRKVFISLKNSNLKKSPLQVDIPVSLISSLNRNYIKLKTRGGLKWIRI